MRACSGRLLIVLHVALSLARCACAGAGSQRPQAQLIQGQGQRLRRRRPHVSDLHSGTVTWVGRICHVARPWSRTRQPPLCPNCRATVSHSLRRRRARTLLWQRQRLCQKAWAGPSWRSMWTPQVGWHVVRVHGAQLRLCHGGAVHAQALVPLHVAPRAGWTLEMRAGKERQAVAQKRLCLVRFSERESPEGSDE